MIVKQIKSQIAFGVIAVVFTCVMAFVHFRNLSDDIVVAEPSAPAPQVEAPVAEPAPIPEPEPVQVAEPEPIPEPEPFVMKEVGGRDEIPGEYLVSFFDERDRKAFEALVAGAGGKVLSISAYGNVIRVKLKDAAQLEDLLRQGPVPLEYSANYNVYYPERPADEAPKPDKFYGTFGKGALPWLGLRVDNMNWGDGVKVAVIDSGVAAHSVFKKDSVRQIDIIGDRGGSGDLSGHGTAVASLIAGWHPEVMGVAPDAQIISVRVTGADGKGDVLDAATGIMRAIESGANVINISLGTYGDSFVLRNAVKEAIRRGVAVVASVGNDGQSGVTFPAGYNGVVGVSSIDALGQKLYFGNTGEGVDICAPGYGVAAADSSGGFLADFSGTSASTPFVSGMIAALMGRGLSAEQAIERVLASADDGGMPGRDTSFGDGMLDIRRVEEYEKAGIRDAAVSCLLLKDGTTVVVGMQNRGTEVLEGARIAVQSGARHINFDAGVTKPGQTISWQFEIMPADYTRDGVLTVLAEIPLAGMNDAYPGNNMRRLVVVDKQHTP